jgi:predicted HicB family RNase H-like nuclease
LWYNGEAKDGGIMATSSAVKRKYNAKAYDQINLTVKKGEKEELQAHAAERGESLNGFVNRAIHETVERDNAQGGEE